MVCRQHRDQTGGTAPTTDIQLGHTTPKVVYLVQDNETGGTLALFDGSQTISSGSSNLLVNQCRLFTGNNGTSKVKQNNYEKTHSGSIASTAATGLRVGSNGVVASIGTFELLALAYYDSYLSAANLNAVQDKIYVSFDLKPQVNDVVVYDGDSITAGFYASYLEKHFSQITNNNSRMLFNPCGGGVPARSAATAKTKASIKSGRTYKTGAINVAVIFYGTNDLSLTTGGVSTAISDVQNIAATYKAAGFRTVMVTCLPRTAGFSGGQTSGNFETERLSFNTQIRALKGTSFDVIADAGGDAVLGQVANIATYFGDGIHPNDSGSAILASIIQKAIMEAVYGSP